MAYASLYPTFYISSLSTNNNSNDHTRVDENPAGGDNSTIGPVLSGNVWRFGVGLENLPAGVTIYNGENAEHIVYANVDKGGATGNPYCSVDLFEGGGGYKKIAGSQQFYPTGSAHLVNFYLGELGSPNPWTDTDGNTFAIQFEAYGSGGGWVELEAFRLDVHINTVKDLDTAGFFHDDTAPAVSSAKAKTLGTATESLGNVTLEYGKGVTLTAPAEESDQGNAFSRAGKALTLNTVYETDQMPTGQVLKGATVGMASSTDTSAQPLEAAKAKTVIIALSEEPGESVSVQRSLGRATENSSAYVVEMGQPQPPQPAEIEARDPIDRINFENSNNGGTNPTALEASVRSFDAVYLQSEDTNSNAYVEFDFDDTDGGFSGDHFLENHGSGSSANDNRLRIVYTVHAPGNPGGTNHSGSVTLYEKRASNDYHMLGSWSSSGLTSTSNFTTYVYFDPTELEDPTGRDIVAIVEAYGATNDGPLETPRSYRFNLLELQVERRLGKWFDAPADSSEQAGAVSVGRALDIGTARSSDLGTSTDPVRAYDANAVQETDSASALTPNKSRETSVSETDQAQALLAPLKSVTLVRPQETNTAAQTSPEEDHDVFRAQDVESAQSVTAIRYIDVGQTSDTESAYTLDAPQKVKLANTAYETDDDQAITAIRATNFNTAFEVEEAHSVSPVKVIDVGRAEEPNYPTVLTALRTRDVNSANETDSVDGALVLKEVTVGVASETSSSDDIFGGKALSVGRCETSVSAGSTTYARGGRLLRAVDTESAHAFDKAFKKKSIGLASSTDTAPDIFPIKPNDFGARGPYATVVEATLTNVSVTETVLAVEVTSGSTGVSVTDNSREVLVIN